MTIYVIATEERKTYGHGDFGTELHVVRMGEHIDGKTGEHVVHVGEYMNMTGKPPWFPPAFRTREAAELYVSAHKDDFVMHVVHILPMELRDE